jgi:hypothetical protein
MVGASGGGVGLEEADEDALLSEICADVDDATAATSMTAPTMEDDDDFLANICSNEEHGAHVNFFV